MNLQPIKMTRWEARETVQQYRSLLKERRTKEDIAIMRSAKAILGGTQVIRVADAVRAGGMDARFLPRIAIARADDPFVLVERWNGGMRMTGTKRRGEYVSDYGSNGWPKRTTQIKARAFRFNMDGGPTPTGGRSTGEAIVPSIPPVHRPLDEHLDRFYILFEAEWSLVAPRDPALLSPLGGGLFAVVAVWDLTDLERAVLAGARGA